MKKLNSFLSPYLFVVWLMAASVLWLDIQEGPHTAYLDMAKAFIGMA